jgi:hypothetical protein
MALILRMMNTDKKLKSMPVAKEKMALILTVLIRF